MMSVKRRAGGVYGRDPYILHHALIFMVEDVAVQDEFADIALVFRPDANAVWRLVRIALLCDKKRILPRPFEAGIDRCIAGIVCTDIIAKAIKNFDDLEGVDVDMERMVGQKRLELPVLYGAKRQSAVYSVRVVGCGIDEIAVLSRSPIWNAAGDWLVSILKPKV